MNIKANKKKMITENNKLKSKSISNKNNNIKISFHQQSNPSTTSSTGINGSFPYKNTDKS
jgi:hypothetical protein